MKKLSDVRQLFPPREPLYQEAKRHILELAAALPQNERRLPSEEELSATLGMSRATIREALSILCREGIVSRRHGIGNLINRSALETTMRFDLEQGLRHMLAHAGYKAESVRFPLHGENGRSFAEQKENAGLLEIPRPWAIQDTRHTADGRAAILGCNVFTLREGKIDVPPDASYSDCVSLIAGEQASHTVTTFLPRAASSECAEAFSLPPGTPLIMWHEKTYGMNDALLCESLVFFHPQLVPLRALHCWTSR